jgi:hypothetical protein
MFILYYDVLYLPMTRDEASERLMMAALATINHFYVRINALFEHLGKE